MKQSAVSSQQSAVSLRKFLIFCLLITAYCSLSCGSIPNFEPPECTESGGVVKEFYSYHFGNEMKFSPENLKPREKFLTAEFVNSLRKLQTENDVFTTNSTDLPKAFRVGKCEVVSADKTVFEVVLFWRDDVRSEQKIIKAEAVKQGDKWLINKVFN
jgi:hypothetical protein